MPSQNKLVNRVHGDVKFFRYRIQVALSKEIVALVYHHKFTISSLVIMANVIYNLQKFRMYF